MKETGFETDEASRQIFLVVAFRVLRSVSAGMITLAFPYLVLGELHYSAFRLGLIYTAATIATAGMGLFFGFLADVGGRKAALISVSILLPLSSLIVLLSTGLPALFAAAVLGGYSATGALAGGGVGGSAMPIQSALVADLTSGRKRTVYFAVIAFLGSIAAAFGSLLVRLMTLKLVFISATAISAVSVLTALPLGRIGPRGNPRVLKSRVVIEKFTITGLLNGFSQGLVMPFLVPFFVIVYRLPMRQMASYAFISGIIGSFSLLLAPWLDRQVGFVKSITVTRGIGAALTALLPLVRVLPVSVAVYLLIPALRVTALPVQQKAMSEMVAPEELGRAFGINQITRLAASSGGTALAGYLLATPLLPLPFFMYGGIMAANVYLYRRFFKS